MRGSWYWSGTGTSWYWSGTGMGQPVLVQYWYGAAGTGPVLVPAGTDPVLVWGSQYWSGTGIGQRYWLATGEGQLVLVRYWYQTLLVRYW